MNFSNRGVNSYFREGLEAIQGQSLETMTGTKNTVHAKLAQTLGVQLLKTEKEKRQLAYKFKLETRDNEQ